MKAKKLLYLMTPLLFVVAPIIRAFGFGDEVDSPIDLFEGSRDFSIIDKLRGEDTHHGLIFLSAWGDTTYSVYIWKHIDDDIYEAKSYFESDIDNFLSLTNVNGYNLTNVKWRKDGRKHIKFKCENLVMKMGLDSYMLSIY